MLRGGLRVCNHTLVLNNLISVGSTYMCSAWVKERGTGMLTCDNANDLARLSPSTMVTIDQRFVIPDTQIWQADSPASRVPVASAFVSSRMLLELWFPNAAMSLDNTSVYEGPHPGGPQGFLTLDYRRERTTTT